MSWTRLATLMRKEFIQLRRDPATLRIILLLPVIQLVLFGYAINTVVDHIPMAVYDQSNTASSRALIAAFQNSTYFDLRMAATSREAAMRAIDDGSVKVAVVIPPDYGDLVLSGGTATAQLVVDGSDPNVSQTSMFAGGLVAQVQSGDVISKLLARVGSRGAQGGIELRPVVLYNPRMLSATFMVPGLIALILQTGAVVLTALAVVRERERGTLEQLIVTPLKPLELMLGKVIPCLMLSFASAVLALVVGRLLFGVGVAGSLMLLFVLILVFLLGSLGIGLLISVVSSSQMQAQQLSQLTLIPSFVLSGFFFPREGMPVALQLLGSLIPMTYFLEIVRGIMLKGVGLSAIWQPALGLTVFAVVIMLVAVNRFHKRIA
jgi:ABC-2 type transport system permease protein